MPNPKPINRFHPNDSVARRGRSILGGNGGWRRAKLLPSFVLVSVVMLVAGGCSQSDDATNDASSTTTTVAPATSTSTTATTSTTTTTTPSTTTASPPEKEERESVSVVADSSYRSTDSALAAVDVYYSTEVTGGPVVVLLHGQGVEKHSVFYPRLAKALAEQGAVVFAPNWGGRQSPDPERGSIDSDRASCAVSYALASAAEFGANPEALVLVGHSGGANVAAMTGVRDATPIDDCTVGMKPFVADRMVLLDGDWLWGGNLDDPHDLPQLMEIASPWIWLADAPAMAVTLATAADAKRTIMRCGVTDPASTFWVRDPDGWFRERLDAINALDDDCMDIEEATAVLAGAMTEHGFDTTELILENSTHLSLSDEDQALLVNAILGAADA